MGTIAPAAACACAIARQVMVLPQAVPFHVANKVGVWLAGAGCITQKEDLVFVGRADAYFYPVISGWESGRGDVSEGYPIGRPVYAFLAAIAAKRYINDAGV